MAGTTRPRLRLTDHLGSVRLVVDTATGAVAQRLDYDEFGQITQDTNPGFQPFGFAGGLYDPDTKLTRLGARDYHAFTGRWTAKDPIRFSAGDSNLYTYVNGNAQNVTDPTGLQYRDPPGGTTMGPYIPSMGPQIWFTFSDPCRLNLAEKALFQIQAGTVQVIEMATIKKVELTHGALELLVNVREAVNSGRFTPNIGLEPIFRKVFSTPADAAETPGTGIPGGLQELIDQIVDEIRGPGTGEGGGEGEGGEGGDGGGGGGD